MEKKEEKKEIKAEKIELEKEKEKPAPQESKEESLKIFKERPQPISLVPQSTEPGFDKATIFSKDFFAEQVYEKDSDYYFDSYSHFSIHEEMLKDKVSSALSC